MSDPSPTERKRERFAALYKSYFGKLPVDFGNPDEGDPWWRMVDRIPFQRLEDVVLQVDRDRGKAKWRPLLGAFTDAWSSMSGNRDYGPRESCGLCDSTGYMLVLGYRDNKRWHLGLGGRNCTTVTIPCLCSKGQKYAAPGSEENRERNKAWLLNIRSEALLAGAIKPRAKDEPHLASDYGPYLEFLARNQREKGRKEAMMEAEVQSGG